MAHDMVGWLRWLRTLEWPWKQQAAGAVKQDLLAELRALLFADEGLESVARYAVGRSRRKANDSWDFFARAAEQARGGHPREARKQLRSLLELAGLDARSRLLAWHCLRQLGETPSREEAGRVLGIIIEGESRQGPDILAAYADGTARLLPPGGDYLMSEKPSAAQLLDIRRFLRTGQPLVHARRPLRGPRSAPPSGTRCRISVLTPAGHHVQEGEREALKQERRTGPILHAAETISRALSVQLWLAREACDEAPLEETPREDAAEGGGPEVH